MSKNPDPAHLADCYVQLAKQNRDIENLREKVIKFSGENENLFNEVSYYRRLDKYEEYRNEIWIVFFVIITLLFFSVIGG